MESEALERATDGAGGAASVLALFAEAVAAHGARPALEVPAAPGRPRARRTYAELDAASTTLARRLAGRVAAEEVVAVLLGRATPALLETQLAVWKAGAAFACLEPGAPDAHLAALWGAPRRGAARDRRGRRARAPRRGACRASAWCAPTATSRATPRCRRRRGATGSPT
ncbi:MAG: AMP-binding protein [Planctomycetes bacterium]|nr:AMP-binding protein [Planctomycetota bacterium]